MDDYAFMIRGLLDLYDACHDDLWVKWAEQLQIKQNDLFWDELSGAYFNSTDKDSSIVLRLKEGKFIYIFTRKYCIFGLHFWYIISKIDFI